MNIPLKVIKSSQMLHSSSLANHQLFGKQMMKLSTKAKSNSSNLKQSKEGIFKWFFSLNTYKRLKVISIQNNWLVRILYEMLFIYKFEKRIEFNPTEDNDEFHRTINTFAFNNFSEPCSPSSDYYFTFYEPLQPMRIDSLKQEIDNHKIHELLKRENEFISNIRFITLDEVNDTLTLSLDLLNNESSFKELFNLFSEGQCFNTHISSIYHSTSKVYNFSLPEWIIQKGRLTICQLIVFYFEQSISSNYGYYILNKDCLYHSPSDDKLRDLLEDNAKIENFLNEESGANKEKFMSLIDYNEIIESIRNDVTVKDMLSEYNDREYQVLKDYQKRISMPINRLSTKRERNDIEGALKSSFNKSIPLFVDMITFIDSKILFKMDNFIYQKVFKLLLDLYSKKNASELINELTNEDNDKSVKKNKKNKKKKKRKIDEENKKDIQEDMKIQTNQAQTIANENKEITKKEKKKNQRKEFFLFTPKEKKTQSSKDANNKSNENKRNHHLQDQKKEIVAINNIITNVNHNQSMIVESENNEKNTITTSTITINHEINDDNSKKENKIVIEQNSTSIMTPENKISISISNPVINNYYIINQQSSPHYNQLQSNRSIYEQPQFPYSRFHYEQQPLFTYRNPFYCSFQMYTNQYSNQFSLTDSAFTLFNKLHKEIDTYSQNVSQHLLFLKDYKLNYISKISTLIHFGLQDKYCIELANYGSFVTGLEIESSDIDIVIKFKVKESNNNELIMPSFASPNVEKVINELTNTFNQVSDLFDYIKPIYSASVPVLKLQCDISKVINQEILNEIKNDFWFDIIEIEKIKLDLTFFEIPNSKYANSIVIPSQFAVEYVNNSSIKFPEIRPLLNVLKRYMQIEKLNLSFNGGISSYSLFLLLFAFLKSNQQKNKDLQHSYSLSLGKLLIEFLGFYISFDFTSFCIDVNALNPFIPLKEKHKSGMLIIDPFTSLNVAKSSFKLDEIKNAFKKAHYITIKHFYTTEINNAQFSILKELFGVKH